MAGCGCPALAFISLLFHLLERRPLLRDGVVSLKFEDERMRGVVPDERIIAELGLKLFASPTRIGDISSDGAAIIYDSLYGFACRNEDAAERVRRLVATRSRDW
ncbi:hypothetical protein [Rhodopseudomonas telluris]|uniref:Uncharacterized protein n=1 Tax=Rhodopseudomonas telluris TaxID=644215 RepID=A0ABV6EPJ2_9BRAD